MLRPTSADSEEMDTMTILSSRVIRGCLMVALVVGCGAEDPQIIEGPFVTPDGPSSVTVVWRTRLESDSRVDYGPTPSYGQRSGSETPTTEHAVRLDGLRTGRKYFVRAASGGGRAEGSFTTGVRYAKGPYSQAVGQNGAVVMWETEPSADGQLILLRDGFPADTLATTGENGVRKAGLDGLEPGTLYRCRAIVEGLASPELRFRTPSPADTSVAFIVYGDSRSKDATAHRALVTRMAELNVEFVLHSGDFVYDGNVEAEWEPMFFGPVGPLALRAPIYPALGNHEEDAQPYYRHFVVPENDSRTRPEAWYSFDHGPLHVVVLDSNPESGRLAKGTEQRTWLERDLEAATARWKIAVFHHPLFSKARHNSQLDLRERLMSLFETHGVDLVFAGHDHGYQRTWPMRDGARADGGVFQVVSAGGGADLYPAGRKWWTAVSQSVHHYCLVRVEGSRLDLDVTDIEGQSIDALTIQQDDVVYGGWIRSAREGEPAARARAIRLLGRTGRLDAVEAVLASAGEADAGAQLAAAEALARIGSPQGKAALGRLAHSADAEARRWAVRGIIDLGGRGAPDICVELLGDRDPGVRRLCAVGLGRQPTARAAAALAAASQDADKPVRLAALEALAVTPGGEAGQALMASLGDTDVEVRRLAFEGVRGKELVAEATPVLIELLPGEGLVMRREIVRALGKAGSSAALPVVRTRVLDEDAATSQIAIRALAERRDAGSVPNLIAALDSDSRGVRTYAMRALVVITKERAGGTVADWKRWWGKRKAETSP